jgi:hypothetical protein
VLNETSYGSWETITCKALSRPVPDDLDRARKSPKPESGSRVRTIPMDTRRDNELGPRKLHTFTDFIGQYWGASV